MTNSVRTHVVLPRSVLDAIDALVGQRRRSQFLTEAAEEKLDRTHETARRAERSAAARLAAGSLATDHIPDWDTIESADAWVRSLREAWDERRPSEDDAR